MSNHQKRVLKFKEIAGKFSRYYANALEHVGNREDVRLRTAQAIQAEIADELQEIKTSAAQALSAKRYGSFQEARLAQHKREIKRLDQFCKELETFGVTVEILINDLEKVPTTN